MTPKQYTKAIEAAAEAAHDTLYDIGPATSSIGYVFEDEADKVKWREVAVAVMRALAEAEGAV